MLSRFVQSDGGYYFLRSPAAIIAAITAQDAAGAVQLANAHWQLSRDRISQFVLPGGLDLPLGPTPQEARA